MSEYAGYNIIQSRRGYVDRIIGFRKSRRKAKRLVSELMGLRTERDMANDVQYRLEPTP